MKEFLLGTVVGAMVGGSYVCYKLLRNDITRAALSDVVAHSVTTALYGDRRGPSSPLRTSYDRPKPAYGRSNGRHRS